MFGGEQNEKMIMYIDLERLLGPRKQLCCVTFQNISLKSGKIPDAVYHAMKMCGGVEM